MTSGARAAGSGPSGRVAIDGYNLALPQGTGVATYGRGLAAALRRLGLGVDGVFGVNTPDRADPLRREIAYFDPPAEARRRSALTLLRGAGEQAAHRLRIAEAREIVLGGAVDARGAADRLPPFDRVWNHRRLFTVALHHFRRTGRRLRFRIADPPAVMHWTYPVPVELVGARNIYTLHDLVPLRLPFTTLDDKPRYLKLMRLLVREADHLVTVSEASRRDVLEVLGVAPERVTNTYQSVEPGPASDPAHDRALVHGALGLGPEGYLLFFGAVEPKKNVGRLLEAYLASTASSPLVLLGKAAWKSDAELGLLQAASEGARRVLRLDHAPRPLLRALVRGARAVLFPSLYEGFGLPVAEALAAGRPVVTADAAALPEVAGDAALLVDPYDVGALAAAISRIDGDDALRATLAGRARAQAARFSPDAYDARLRDLYLGLGVALGR